MSARGGDAGLTFRVTAPAVGTDSYRGYYAGIGADGTVVLGRVDNSWTPLRTVRLPIAPGSRHKLRVTAVGPALKVYVDDMRTPKISVTDATFTSGANGVRVFNTPATFDNVAVGPAT